MDFDYSAKVKDLQEKLTAFMKEHVYPNEKLVNEQIARGDRWTPIPLIEEQIGRASCRERVCYPV